MVCSLVGLGFMSFGDCNLIGFELAGFEAWLVLGLGVVVWLSL